jgi:hypothetical protein
VTLTLNGGSPLTLTADGAFTFPTQLATGASYTVAISSENQTCSLTGASGIAGPTSATAVSVSCTGSFFVGGSLQNFGTGHTINLLLNGANQITLGADGAFTFPTPLPTGTSYTISIGSLNDPGVLCGLSGASGVAGPSSATAVTVTCWSILLPGTPQLGPAPYSVSFSPTAITWDGSSLWVTSTNYGTSGMDLNQVDPFNANLLASYHDGQQLDAVLFDGTYLWASDASGQVVKKISLGPNPPAGFVLASAQTSTDPVAVVFDGANIWSMNRGSDNVTKIQASNGTVVCTYNVGTNPVAGVFDGTNLWVVNQGSRNVTELLASSGSLVNTYTFNTNPQSAASFGGPNLWVGLAGDNNNGGYLAKLSNCFPICQTSTYPFGVTLNYMLFDGATLWGASSSGYIYQFSPFDGSVGQQYVFGGNINGLFFDGHNLWISSGSSSELTKIPVR